MRTDNTILVRVEDGAEADMDYLCEALKSSAQFGVVLNITKAVARPTTCRVFAPSVSNCGRQSFSALFFFIFFAFWKISSCLVARKISSCGISTIFFFFFVIDCYFVFS